MVIEKALAYYIGINSVNPYRFVQALHRAFSEIYPEKWMI